VKPTARPDSDHDCFDAETVTTDDGPTKRGASPMSVGRRTFLGKAGGLTAASIAAGAIGLEPLAGSRGSRASAQELDPQKTTGNAISGHKREKMAFNTRVDAAQDEKDRPVANHPDNGDEARYASRIGSYSKALPHNGLGEVNPGAYDSLLRAVNSGDPADFDSILMGLGVKLTNPQSGLAFDMMGPDSHALMQPPAPTFSSAEEASEIAENYWMALTRDVPYSQYDTNPLTIQAATDLSGFSDFRGPKTGGQVTTATLFRGIGPGTGVGPYISQFMWKDTPFGAETVDRRMRTTIPGMDYMTSYAEWLAIQNGAAAGPPVFDGTRRYIRNGRDIGEWVHIDVLFQAYFNALLILFSIGAPLDNGNPYKTSRNQIGFGTLGDPYIAATMCSVATRALKAVWYQKWFVHRRLRPEEFGGRVHNHITRAANYPIHSDILNSAAVAAVFSRYGTYLLPMGFPEGCPTHPAYGAGHGTVAGACTTVLKAYFDESFVIPDPVVPSDDGLTLLDFSGPALTVGGELNKLANNVAIGRNIAGVHWRTDGNESLRLGEELAIRALREEKPCFNENFNGFSLTKFDGTTITI